MCYYEINSTPSSFSSLVQALRLRPQISCAAIPIKMKLASKKLQHTKKMLQQVEHMKIHLAVIALRHRFQRFCRTIFLFKIIIPSNSYFVNSKEIFYTPIKIQTEQYSKKNRPLFSRERFCHYLLTFISSIRHNGCCYSSCCHCRRSKSEGRR